MSSNPGVDPACLRAPVCPVMLNICNPCIRTLRSGLLIKSTCQVAPFTRAAASQKAMSHELSSQSLLDDQSFGGDSLNRSIGDRRNDDFVSNAFEGSSNLLVTGRSVLSRQSSSSTGSNSQHTEICWLAPSDLQDYGIEPQTDSQTTVTGMLMLTPAQSSAQSILLQHHLASPTFSAGCRSASRSFGALSAGSNSKGHLVLCH